jgi:HPt (histidine-containing phosphotransfer) domain-containing protein
MFDQRHFSEMTGGDLALQREVVGLFRGQVEDWRAALSPEHDPSVWQETAHKLKGSARAIGLWELGEACDVAEHAAAADADAALSKVRHLLDTALLDLAAY